MTEQTTPLAFHPDPTPDDVRPARTVRVGYLVMGLVFLGIAGIWALNASGTVDWRDSKYAFPAVLVGAGLLGLVATLAINATRRTGAEGAAAAPEDDNGDEDRHARADDLTSEEETDR